MKNDPYRYFRIEAREILEGLNRGILELERGLTSPELVGRLLRLAHTLKGAARVVKQFEIGNLSHAIEDVLARFRDGSEPVPRERIDELLRLLNGIASQLSALDAGAETAPSAPESAAPDGALETVRVDLHEMDALLGELTEATASLSATRFGLDEIGRAAGVATALNQIVAGTRSGGGNGASAAAYARVRNMVEELQMSLAAARDRMEARLDRAERGLIQARETADRLRLLPAGSIFVSLERAVRDVAQALGKRVEFQSSGGENRIDAHVLAIVREALLHAVRNAVAHGLETDAERAASGKSVPGRVEILVERRGNRVAFTCRDDGRGIDVEAVRRAAVRNKLLSESEAQSLDLDRVLQLMLKGGLTTTRAVTHVAGRGVGLDVVRVAAERLKGDVRLRTNPGRGTTLELSAPVSLTSLESIFVEAAGAVSAIPLDSVSTTLRVSDQDIVRSAAGDSILWEGAAVPIVPLARLLGRESPNSLRPSARSAVVVKSESESAAVAVERIAGTGHAVARPLPEWIQTNGLVGGAALDADGQPILILDPNGIVRASRAPIARGPEMPSLRPRILIIDDSLTTRMLEQSILETAGYEADVSVSGEEALAKARSHSYGLFVVDIEMPGMDGFQFIAQTQIDPALRRTPSILVTSRSSEEDRRRAEDLGARAYIVKGEFDQRHLLESVRELMGQV